MRRSSIPFSVWLCSLTALLCAVAANARGEAPSTYTIDEILEKWHQREQLLKTARFQWSAHQTSRPWDDAGPRTSDLVAFDVPIVSLELNELGMFRYETVQVDTEAVLDGRSLPRLTSAWNGRQSQMLLEGGGRPTLGTIYKADSYKDQRTIYILPAYGFFRPVQAWTTLTKGATKSLGETVEYRGTTCQIVIERDAAHGLVHEYWVAPDVGFNVRRFMGSNLSGQQWATIEIDYQSHRDLDWCPASWKLSLLASNGDPLESAEAMVTEVRLNESIPVDRFTLAYPEGALVFDERQNRHFQAASDGRLMPYTGIDRSGRLVQTYWVYGLALMVVAALILSRKWWARR